MSLIRNRNSPVRSGRLASSLVSSRACSHRLPLQPAVVAAPLLALLVSGVKVERQAQATTTTQHPTRYSSVDDAVANEVQGARAFARRRRHLSADAELVDLWQGRPRAHHRRPRGDLADRRHRGCRTSRTTASARCCVRVTYDFPSGVFTKLGWDHYAKVGDGSTGQDSIDNYSLGVGMRF